MNEKEKKSLIIISSVFIFVLVFMVFFTFYRRDAMLSDRTIPKENTKEDDPTSLGDTCTTNTTCKCSSGTKCGSQCCLNSRGSMAASTCYASGGTYYSGTCYGKVVSQTCTTTTTCTSCDSGKYLSGGSCHTCDSGDYCIYSQSLPCPANSTSYGGAARCVCITGYTDTAPGLPAPNCVKNETPTPTPTSTPYLESVLHCCNGNIYKPISQVNGYPASCATAGYTSATSSNNGWICGNSEETGHYDTNCYTIDSGCSYKAISGTSCNNSTGQYADYNTCRQNLPTSSTPTPTPTPTSTPISCLSGQYLSGSSCQKCPSPYISSVAGATSSSQCYMIIPTNYEVLVPYGQQSQCPSGYEQKSSNRVYYGSILRCTPISSATSTPTPTPTPMASPSNCLTGQYYNGSSCQNCPDPYTSSEAGATSIIQCYMVVSKNNEILVPYGKQSQCPSGYEQPTVSKINYGSTIRCTPISSATPTASPTPTSTPYIESPRLNCCNGNTYIVVKQVNGFPASCATAGYTSATSSNNGWICGNSDEVGHENTNCYTIDSRCSYEAISGTSCNNSTGQYADYDTCRKKLPTSSTSTPTPTPTASPTPSTGSVLHCCNGNIYKPISQVNGYPGSCATAGYTSATSSNNGWICGNSEETGHYDTNCYTIDSGCSYKGVSGTSCNNSTGQYADYNTCRQNLPTSSTSTSTPKPVNERPSYCLSYVQCVSDANNKCVGIKNGCSKVVTIDGYDCYTYTCTENRPVNCPSQAQCLAEKCTYGEKEACRVTNTEDGVDCYKHTCNEAPAGTGNCCYYSGGEYKYVLTTSTECTDTYHGTTNESQINCLAKNGRSSCEQYAPYNCPSNCINTGSSCKTPVTCDSLPCCYTGSDGVERNVYDSTVCQDKTINKTCGACPGQPTPGLNASDCKITSLSIISKSVSVDSDSYSNNSYYVALVSVSGSGCSKNTVSLVTNNGRVSPSSRVITSSSETETFMVYPSEPCVTANVYARLSNGKTSETKSIEVIRDWEQHTGCYKPNGNTLCGSNCNTSFADADKQSENEYYSSWDNVNKCYTEYWTRGCGPSRGYSGTPSVTSTPTPLPVGMTPTPTPVGMTPTPTPLPYGETPTPTPAPTYACYANAKDLINATKTIWATSSSPAYPYLISGKTQADCKAYACFANSDGSDYKWANTTPSGYTKVSNVLSQILCKPESDGCYIDKNGNYSWGKHKNDSNYTYVASITDSNKCKVISGSACYCNDSNCVWNTTSPGSDYVKVPDMDTSVKCKKDEYACFLHNNKYIWGNYMNQNGYFYVAGITEQEYCTNIGCYVNNNEYVWGDYSDDSSYTFVSDITERSRCGYAPDVPMTAMNTQMIIYIATAIMSVAGLYFVVRYNNKSKNI